MAEMVINGAAFNVVVEGEADAPALILAHPLGANLHIFDALMPALLQQFRVVRYDARGHGSSVVSPGPYSLAQLGEDAAAILAALEIEKAHWLGVSMGGMTGLWLLSHAPERLGHAVLAHVTAHFGSVDTWNERIETVYEKGLDALAPAILENWFTKGFREHHQEQVELIREMLLASPVEGYAGACAALRDMDQREAIRSIRKPVLVIVGRHDPVTTPGLGGLVASAISGARLVTLETAHMSCVEDPEGFSQAVIEFLMTEDAPMIEEEPEHEAIIETPPAPPPKKPRKPRKPRLPPEPAGESELALEPAEGSPSDSYGESESEAAIAPLPMPARKPRKPRAKPVVPVVPVAPPAPIVVAAPQPRKRPVKKAAAKKAAPKKVPAKKAAVKKSPARKAVGKKAPVKKIRAAGPARKAVAKKTVAKKAPIKKGAMKKAAAKKAPIRKIAAKKASVRKAVVKKTQAKKLGAKKAATKKTAARKPMPRHLPGRRPTRKR